MSDKAYNEAYYERGEELGISGYTDYRWLPELTIPMAFRFIERLNLGRSATILDYGCAKGYLVKALRLLGRQAFGCDISSYALERAPEEVKRFLFKVIPNDIIPVPSKGRYDWLIAKDVLEHIPYSDIDRLLRQFEALTHRAFFAIPLSEDGKYVVLEYEGDVTHIIRENLAWWADRFRQAGFVVRAQYHWRGLKENWSEWPRGNGFFTVVRKELV